MESRDDLKAYLDGELNPAQAEAVRLAAETDPEVQRELDEIRLVGSALSSMTRDYEVSGLEQTLRALDGDVRGSHTGAPKKRWTWYGVGVAIAAAVTVLYALPPMFGQAKVSAKSMLASRRFEDAQAAAPAFATQTNGLSKSTRNQGFRRQPVGAGRAGGAAPVIPPLSVQDQLKADEAKMKRLQDENARLKAEEAATSKNLVPTPAATLPAPILPGEIVPNGALANSSSNDNVNVEVSKGVPPQRIAQLEGQVKKLALSAGAKLESAAGPSVMRVLSLTIESSKVARLADQIRGVLKSSGSVTVEAIAPAAESAVIESTKAKIVDFKLQRERLLVDFLPEAPQIVELDRQIKILEASIKPDTSPPKSRLHVSIG